MCGGSKPYGAKSRWAKNMPRVFKPSSISTFTRVTLNPTLFAVFARILSPEKKKSSAVTVGGSLQNFSFTNTTRRKVFHCKKKKKNDKTKQNTSVTMDKSSKKKKTDVDDDTTIRHVFINFYLFFN